MTTAGSTQASTPGGWATSDCVFNVVWTGSVFTYLKYFVCSLIEHTDARFRFVTNDCTSGSIAEMRTFADQHPDRVVEVLDVSPDRMVAHGQALDSVIRQRDDGDLFCLVDADIRASGPFLGDFVRRLDHVVGVSSGREVWNDDNVVVPDAHVGVGGRHFFDGDGFVFGSPHFAVYRREPVVDTMQRWDVGFGSAGPELSDAASNAIQELGHPYRVYDTGKIVNVLLQVDGHVIEHFEHPSLMHIGGMSHYLSPSGYVEVEGDDEPRPEWARFPQVRNRFEVAKYTAGLLRSLAEGAASPVQPSDLDDDLRARLDTVHDAVTDLVDRHRSC